MQYAKGDLVDHNFTVVPRISIIYIYLKTEPRFESVHRFNANISLYYRFYFIYYTSYLSFYSSYFFTFTCKTLSTSLIIRTILLHEDPGFTWCYCRHKCESCGWCKASFSWSWRSDPVLPYSALQCFSKQGWTWVQMVGWDWPGSYFPECLRTSYSSRVMHTSVIVVLKKKTFIQSGSWTKNFY